MLTKLLKTTAAVALWALYWYSAQYPFTYIFNLLNIDLSLWFPIYAGWVIFTAIMAFSSWYWLSSGNLSFLKPSDKRVFWLYLIPAAIIAVMMIINGGQYGSEPAIYITSLLLITFVTQDLLTFGYLQTYLEGQMPPVMAWLLTAFALAIGQGLFELNTLPNHIESLLFLSLLGFLRYKTKNIYLSNIFHISFLLLPFGR